MNLYRALVATALTLTSVTVVFGELRVEVEATYQRAFISPNVYTYSVENLPSSTKGVEIFALDLGSPPSEVSEVTSPAGWTSRRCGPGAEKLCWVWEGQEAGRLEPGRKLSGFGFRSWAKPGDGQCYLAGTSPTGATPDLEGPLDEGFISASIRAPRGKK